LTNIKERPDGIIIASCFIVFILTVSGVSRYWRARELRVGGYRFSDAESERLWKMIADKNVSLVPVPSLDPAFRAGRPPRFANTITSRVCWFSFT
jgi:hypothetical protein